MSVPAWPARLGLTYRQVDYWTRCGWLRPEREPVGSGHQREWSAAELRVAADMGRLVRLGIRPEVAGRAARAGRAGQVLSLLDPAPCVGGPGRPA